MQIPYEGFFLFHRVQLLICSWDLSLERPQAAFVTVEGGGRWARHGSYGKNILLHLWSIQGSAGDVYSPACLILRSTLVCCIGRVLLHYIFSPLGCWVLPCRMWYPHMIFKPLSMPSADARSIPTVCAVPRRPEIFL